MSHSLLALTCGQFDRTTIERRFASLHEGPNDLALGAVSYCVTLGMNVLRHLS